MKNEEKMKRLLLDLFGKEDEREEKEPAGYKDYEDSKGYIDDFHEEVGADDDDLEDDLDDDLDAEEKGMDKDSRKNISVMLISKRLGKQKK